MSHRRPPGGPPGPYDGPPRDPRYAQDYRDDVPMRDRPGYDDRYRDPGYGRAGPEYVAPVGYDRPPYNPQYSDQGYDRRDPRYQDDGRRGYEPGGNDRYNQGPPYDRNPDARYGNPPPPLDYGRQTMGGPPYAGSAPRPDPRFENGYRDSNYPRDNRVDDYYSRNDSLRNGPDLRMDDYRPEPFRYDSNPRVPDPRNGASSYGPDPRNDNMRPPEPRYGAPPRDGPRNDGPRYPPGARADAGRNEPARYDRDPRPGYNDRPPEQRRGPPPPPAPQFGPDTRPGGSPRADAIPRSDSLRTSSFVTAGPGYNDRAPPDARQAQMPSRNPAASTNPPRGNIITTSAEPRTPSYTTAGTAYAGDQRQPSMIPRNPQFPTNPPRGDIPGAVVDVTMGGTGPDRPRIADGQRRPGDPPLAYDRDGRGGPGRR